MKRETRIMTLNESDGPMVCVFDEFRGWIPYEDNLTPAAEPGSVYEQ